MKVIRYNIEPSFIPETMTAIADTLQRFLERIDYKDGWEWVITAEAYAVHVAIKWPVIDVATKQPGFVLGASHRFHLPTQLENEQYLLHAAYLLIKDAEVHELREWFNLDGVKIYDPHADWPAQPPSIPELPQPAPQNADE